MTSEINNTNLGASTNQKPSGNLMDNSNIKNAQEMVNIENKPVVNVQTNTGLENNDQGKATNGLKSIEGTITTNNTEKQIGYNASPVPNPKPRISGGSLSSKFGAVFNMNSQSKTFMAGGFTILFAAILVMFAIRPVVTDIFRIRHQLKQYKEVALQLDSKIDRIYSLSDTFQRNKGTLALFDIYYPHNLDYALFVANLEDITKDIGTRLINVSYSDITGKRYEKEFKKRGITAIDPIVFSITIEGNYNQLVTFLKRIEQTPFLPEVLNLSYQAATPNKKQTFTITVLLFRLKKPVTKPNKDIYEYITNIQ